MVAAVLIALAAVLSLAQLANAKTALVLGSGGLVGSGLVETLRNREWDVLEVGDAEELYASEHLFELRRSVTSALQVVNRTHIDLRQAGALDVFE